MMIIMKIILFSFERSNCINNGLYREADTYARICIRLQNFDYCSQ